MVPINEAYSLHNSGQYYTSRARHKNLWEGRFCKIHNNENYIIKIVIFRRKKRLVATHKLFREKQLFGGQMDRSKYFWC